MVKIRERFLQEQVLEALKTRPLVYLNGGRQVGKSTLCDKLSWPTKVQRISFDTPRMLREALNAPEDFMEKLSPKMLNIIDEVQFAPQIFPYLKIRIDESRLAGKNRGLFLLTGSANLMALPQLSNALVGRMAIRTLYPFSAAEYVGSMSVDFFADSFMDGFCRAGSRKRDIVTIMRHSTYPEIALQKDINRQAWFDEYLATILQRDVKAMSDIKNPSLMTEFLAFMVLRTGSQINMSSVAQEMGIDVKTAEKLLILGLNSFLLILMRPWFQPNRLNKRFVKSPKVYFIDTNFLANFLKMDLAIAYEQDQAFWGHLLENFVATELIKLASLYRWELLYFRTLKGQEVDFVIEKGNDLIGIEVKNSTTASSRFIKGLQELRAISGKRFKRGIVLYLGKDIESLGDDCWAIPLSIFWQWKNN